MGFLSDPRAPSTSSPLSKALRSIPAKWDLPRMPDRGAHVPIAGIRTLLPNGTHGGIPRMPPSLWAGFEKTTIPKVNQSQAQTLMFAVKRQINLARIQRRPLIDIRPGNSGLDEAKRGPLRIDPRSGYALFRRGTDYGIREPRARGLLAQHRTVPSDILDAMAINRFGRGTKVVATGIQGSGGRKLADDAPDKVSDSSIRKIESGGSISLAGQQDQGIPTVRSAPQATLTTGVGIPAGEQTERLLLLAGVILVAWLVLR